MRKIFTLMLQAVLVSSCLAAEPSPLRVPQGDLNQYWQVSVADMAPKTPILARSIGGILQKRGEVMLDYDFTINSKGVPVDLKMNSITPSDVDPRPFKADILFHRYRPGPKNPQRRPVRVHITIPWYIPTSLRQAPPSTTKH